MATISSRVEIAYQEEKPVLIPKERIINSMDKQWLRLRLTSQPIIQLLAGQNIAKNSSLSGSQGLTAIIAARNKEYDKEPPAAEQEDQPAEALFDEPVPKSRKRVNSQEPEQVTIEVQGQAINCLMSGQRPRGTDLTIELDNNQPSSKTAGQQPLRIPSSSPREATTRGPGSSHFLHGIHICTSIYPCKASMQEKNHCSHHCLCICEPLAVMHIYMVVMWFLRLRHLIACITIMPAKDNFPKMHVCQ